MSAIKDLPASARETAADWVLRLREPDVSEQTVSDWIAWCNVDERNRSAFEAMEELWTISGKLSRDRPLSQPRAKLFDFRTPWGRWNLVGLTGAAAAVLAATMWAVFYIAAPKDPKLANMTAQLETQRGAIRTNLLTDGSEVVLGGQTAVSVRYSSRARLVVEDSGEAYFKVAKQHERPFVVQAGPVTVTAVGTQFTVERDGDSVSVAVSEGVVEVRTLAAGSAAGEQTTRAAAVSTLLAAGQRIRFDRGELTQSLQPAINSSVASWREGRLEFRGEPLRLAVARINRYSTRQLEIGDRSIEDLRVTGTAYPDRMDAWLAGIQAVLPVKVVYEGSDRAIIQPAGSQPGH